MRRVVAGLSLHQSPSTAKLHWTLGTLLGTLLGAQLGGAAGRITKLHRAIRQRYKSEKVLLQALGVQPEQALLLRTRISFR